MAHPVVRPPRAISEGTTGGALCAGGAVQPSTSPSRGSVTESDGTGNGDDDGKGFDGGGFDGGADRDGGGKPLSAAFCRSPGRPGGLAVGATAASAVGDGVTPEA
jgi:hypothetical protein